MKLTTADLCDEHAEIIKVTEPVFKNFGGHKSFAGQIQTVKVHEDNVLVKEILSCPGKGQVLVVDGGGSLRCALVGDVLAQLAVDNGWVGIVVYGCIRDSVAIAKIALGLKALNTHPLKSIKRGCGERDLPVHFAGVSFFPGHYLYADEDGIVVSPHSLIKEMS